MDLFKYEFGYGWLYNYGHLLPIAVSGVLLLVAWRSEWPRWVRAVAGVGVAWGVAGLLIVQLVLRFNLPMMLPTESFLASGQGTVLDGGAGSGRSSLMVLLERPQAKVIGVDLYEGDYGIGDNGPERLMANARRAGVAERVEARVGDLRDLPLEDESLDGAISAFVIDHMGRESRDKAFAEIHRVLRNDGQFLLVVVNPDVWIRTAWPFFVHHGYWGSSGSHDRWQSEVESAGFEVEERDTIPGALYVLARKTFSPARLTRASSRVSRVTLEPLRALSD